MFSHPGTSTLSRGGGAGGAASAANPNILSMLQTIETVLQALVTIQQNLITCLLNSYEATSAARGVSLFQEK